MEHEPVLVLLASHSYSFSVDIAPNATVQELKLAISQQCIGRPSVSGQRIIVQGRVLKDEDTLTAISPRTVHLAVHPSAWNATPPASPRRPTTLLPTISYTSLPPASSAPAPNQPPAQPLPLALQLSTIPTEYMTHVHANALRVLQGQPTIPWPGPSELAHARKVTRTVVKYAGLGWSPVLEQDLPTTTEASGGLQYTTVIIDNLPYLALASTDSIPTPAQSTALEILTYTFPLLPLLKHLPRLEPAAPTPAVSRTGGRRVVQGPNGPMVANAGGANLIRRFGVNIRVQPGGGVPPNGPLPPGILIQGPPGVPLDDENPMAYFPPVPEFRFQFQFRLPPAAVLLQLFFTLSRAALLLYFFTPARDPMWLAAIVGWLGWEMYVVFRGHVRDDGEAGRGRGAAANAAGEAGGAAPAPARPGNAAPADGAAPNANVGVGAPNARAAGAAAQRVTELTRLVDRLAHINLAAEKEALARAISPPTGQGSSSTANNAPPVGALQAGNEVAPRRPVLARIPTLVRRADNEAAMEPSLVHRIMTFLALFFLTLVPVVWDRRRSRLMAREGWVREMFHAGRADPNAAPPRTVVGDNENGESTTEAPQPPSGLDEGLRRKERLGVRGWRRAYVEKVIEGEIGGDVDF